MKFYAPTALLALAGMAAAELPQEHSHEPVLRDVRVELNKNNPLEIGDPVFALLGNAAAAKGAGKVKEADLDCLQQIVADQAFTNAKADGSVDGQVTALLFAALERNTAAVGTPSVVCSTVKATNPEIAAITRIQDPASAEGKAGNKQAILNLAVQIAKVGGDPLLANQAGTFKPGDVNDRTGKGNTCDDANDAKGCIFTQNLLVIEATDAEIKEAVAAAGAGNGNGNVNDAADSGCNAAGDKNNAAGGNANGGGANNNNGAGNNNNGAGNNNNGAGNNNNNNNGGANNGGGGANIQTFTGTLGGAAPAVTFEAGAQRPFSTNGNTFTTANAALTRSCDIQNNKCFNAANSGQLAGGTQQCQQQQQQCIASVPASAAAAAKARRSVITSGRRLARR